MGNDEGVYLCLLGTLQNKSRLVMEGTISQLYYQYLVLTYEFWDAHLKIDRNI